MLAPAAIANLLRSPARSCGTAAPPPAALALVTARADAGSHGPQLTVVRERHALGPAGRARSVEHHRRFAGLAAARSRRGRDQGSWQSRQTPRGVEVDHGQSAGSSARPSASQNAKSHLGVRQDERDGLARKLDVHGNGDNPARMIAKYAIRTSARLSERMAIRSPRARPRAASARAQALTCRSSSPCDSMRGFSQSRQSISARSPSVSRDRRGHQD